jgi:hypothetical protein
MAQRSTDVVGFAMDPATFVSCRVIAARAFTAHIDGEQEILLGLQFDNGQSVSLLIVPPSSPQEQLAAATSNQAVRATHRGEAAAPRRRLPGA